MKKKTLWSLFKIKTVERRKVTIVIGFIRRNAERNRYLYNFFHFLPNSYSAFLNSEYFTKREYFTNYNIYTNIIPRKILFKFKFIFPFHGICRYTRIMNKSITFAMVTFILLSTLICQSHQVEVKKTNFYNFSFFFLQLLRLLL